MSGTRLYFRLIAASIRAQVNYPGTFVVTTIGNGAGTFIEFAGIWALFARFEKIRGWTLVEVAMFYAIVSIMFAIADALSRGFEVFGDEFVRTGNFDRVLLRPRATPLLIAGYELRMNKFGRLVQGVIVFAIAAPRLSIQWSLSSITLLAMSIAGGVALFIGILILLATLSFWTVEGLEIANTLTYGGVEAAQYPLDVYARWFRNFLIFGVPLGCVAYLPIVRILGRTAVVDAPPWMLAASPLVGFVFLAMALAVWRVGVRHYASTGS
jgi:ABC-2 type transport system permease protein